MIAVSGPEDVKRRLHPPVWGGSVCLGLFFRSFCGLAGFSGLYWCCFATVQLLNSHCFA